jgi:hypothetical protein
MNQECACGCGETPSSGQFRPGHDQRLRADLERRVGGLLALADLVSSAEQFTKGELPLDTLGRQVAALLAAKGRS